jgi:hypothetical protein
VLDRGQVAQHGARMLGEIMVVELVGEVGDRAPFVVFGDIEKFGKPRSESLDPHRSIKEQSSHIGRRHEVLKVAVRAGNTLELQFQFIIDGLKFFIY